MRISSLLGPVLLPIGLLAQPTVDLQPVANGLGFLVDITNAGDDRLFCLTQNGLIHIVQDGVVSPDLFMDITAQVWGSGELGSLGLAFDPDHANNGYFYVHYTALTEFVHTRISRFQVSATDPNVGDPSTELILWTYPHPSNIHKGGDLKFGPDGYLYFTLGDGSFPSNGQDLSEPLGSILRIDVSGGEGYAIPSTNPFAGAVDTVPEVWAFGLRNPWRMSFDALNGDLWFGDVGAQEWEEIDRIPAGDNSGPNFGWNCFEGLEPVPNAVDCAPFSEYVPPVIVHPHSDSWCAVIGGRVYRGTQYPDLFGRYLYTDLCAGVVRSLLPDGNGGWTSEGLASGLPFGLTCIGEDRNGELYFGHQGGTLYKLIGPISTGSSNVNEVPFQISPNPATDRIEVKADLKAVTAILFMDATGRVVVRQELDRSLNVTTIDVSDLPSGAYHLRAIGKNGALGRTVVIQHQ